MRCQMCVSEKIAFFAGKDRNSLEDVIESVNNDPRIYAGKK